jgi:hypothetical protein
MISQAAGAYKIRALGFAQTGTAGLGVFLAEMTPNTKKPRPKGLGFE